MTETIEGVFAAVAAANKQDDKFMCPFCTDKKLSDCPAKGEKKVTTKVVSKPKQLACADLNPKGEFDYTTAKHHLISAKQCYAKLRRLVRMGSLAGYDINDPPNGIPLPTVANNLRYSVNASRRKKYGQLDDDEKQTVAFAVMGVEKAQWHVGHHAVVVELAEHWADEEEDDPWRRGHLVSYDTQVIRCLLDILSQYKSKPECDQDDPGKFKQDMDALSGKIKGKLNQFKADNPGGSSPFFVSQLACDFAKSKSAAEAPPPKPSLGRRA